MVTGTVARTLGPRVHDLLTHLLDRFEARRSGLIAPRQQRFRQLQSEGPHHLVETAHVRRTEWRVDPLPPELLERRVELIGGCTRSDLIHGLNAGAKSYIADMWNFTCGDPWSVMRAHRVLSKAARMDLAYLDPAEGRVRANPRTQTRLMVCPRPLHVLESSVLIGDEPVPAAILDLAVLGAHALSPLSTRQGGLFLLLRDIRSHQESRLWAQMLDEVEMELNVDRGTIRATIMIDSLAGALEADEILFEMMHHAAGIAIDPQGFASDHIALFNGPDAPVLPDRESIGLNAPFLLALSTHLIGLCHRRGCHAIGAPSFVLPPLDPAKLKPAYQEMLADKEREAAEGFDGTMVVHEDTVNAAITAFNKRMPLANQLAFIPEHHIDVQELITVPKGEITVESLVGTIRTILRSLVLRWQGDAHVVQGSRLHDRSSLRLALRLLWQWCHSKQGIITATKLDIHDDLLRYMVRKEADKMFAESDARTKSLSSRAVSLTLDLVLSDEVPMEPQA